MGACNRLQAALVAMCGQAESLQSCMKPSRMLANRPLCPSPLPRSGSQVDILRSQTDNLFASGTARKMTVSITLGERGQVNVTE